MTTNPRQLAQPEFDQLIERTSALGPLGAHSGTFVNHRRAPVTVMEVNRYEW